MSKARQTRQSKAQMAAAIFFWRGRDCFISILVGIAVGALLPLISASFAA